MKYQRLFLLCCIFIASLLPKSGFSCTTFCLDNSDQLVVGKNFDWTIGEALIIINKRNVSKTAALNPDWVEEQPASWISKYGSVTFNPWGREFPFSGINESGLVVSAMGLGGSEYPAPDARPCITANQWIQYQLDNFETAQEVIASDTQLRISHNDHTPYHFLVCDRTADCVSIEFLGGEMVYHTRETMPVKVLTNRPYAYCIEYWEKDEIPITDYSTSIERFITAAEMLANYDQSSSGPVTEYAFNILSHLTWFAPTQWSIVYDMQSRRINFQTLDNKQVRYLDVSSFDFSCSTPVTVLDVKEDLAGDVSGNFVDYTYEINRELIEKTYSSMYDLPEEVLDALAHYPETTVCTEIDCFIATAAYGSPLETQVEILREFRDRFLLNNMLGNTFVRLYHTYSPPIAHFIAGHDIVRALVRIVLLPTIGLSWTALKLGSASVLMLLSLLTLLIVITAIKRKTV